MRRVALSVLLGGLVGCGFSPSGNGASGDAPIAPSDARTPSDGSSAVRDGGSGSATDAAVTRGIPHLPAGQTAGSGDVTWSGAVAINTSSNTVSPGLPAGADIARVAQSSSGPALSVLHAHALHIAAGATVTITGGFPLVILADTIDDAGAIDAAGHGTTAGPGAQNASPGNGGAGAHAALLTDGDAGGGGGGFGTAGALGGETDFGTCSASTVAGGAAGVATNGPPLAVLAGGFSGGEGSFGDCFLVPADGGGGGGALQLSALTSIDIETTATISVSGGGGGGGPYCLTGDGGAGAGGGAGGALMLDAPTITQNGLLAANGGGGGGGSCPAKFLSGSAGADGSASTSAAAGGAGADGSDACGFDGGSGAATGSATAGRNAGCEGDGGGGGGGAGIILLHLPNGVAPLGTGTASPAAQLTTF